jgi:O-antigen ligase
MVKLWNFFKENLLKIGISFLIIFIPWYPKLPSVHIIHTWVYIRFEDFFILLIVVIWLLQLISRRVKLPSKIWKSIGFYWLAGFLSLVFSILFIGPHLLNFFPSVAGLYYGRHIEYMILFFVAFSTIRSVKDLRDYLIILSVAVIGLSLYAIGQRFYLDLWAAFPKFFEKYPFCFPSFQTGNEEFAKGIPLCLPKDARIPATFAGHYDLAAYLVLVIPILTGILFFIKKRIYQILALVMTVISIMVLIFTASRVSFAAYLLGLTATLVLLGKKKFIIPFFILSIFLLLLFSGSTAKRFMETFRFASVVTNNQGQVVGQLPADLKNKVSSNNVIENIPTQSLPTGSGFLGLPQINAPQTTNQAVIQTNLSISQEKKLKLENGGVEISTISGNFLIKKVLVYDISFTTRFQAEWPNAWNAFLRNPLLGSGFATVTLAVDNNLLRILGETGLLGMISFLSIFLVLLLILKQVAPDIKDNIAKAFLFGLAGGVLGLFFNAVLIDVFEASKVAETLWILLGIGAGVAFLYRKEFEYKKYITGVLSSHFLIGFYLFVLALVFYLKSVASFFVADDFTWLKWAATTNLSELPKLFINAQGFFYRPLDKTLMFFLYTLFSFSAPGYHVSMLVLYFISAIGVYILVQKLFHKKILSFIGAFIFLFLPSQGENVFWISTISNNLSTLFIVYMLIFWLNFRNSQSKLNFVLAFVFAVLAFLSYEISIIVLPLLILFDVFITKVKITKVKTILSYVPFAILTVIYPIVRILSHVASYGGDYAYNIPHLIPNFIGNFIGYFGLMTFGEPFLPLYTASRSTLKEEMMLVVILLAVLLVALAVIIFVKRQMLSAICKNETLKLVLFSILFSFIGLVPFLGLGNIAERYEDLAAVGFSILMVVIFAKISGFVKNIKLQACVLIVLTLLLGGWYYSQNRVETAQWSEAGRITNRTLSYLRLYYDGSHPNSNFYFVDLPTREAQAWIFPAGSLSDGMWFIYRDDTIKVDKLSTIEEGKTILTTSNKLNNFVFAFDKNGNIYAVK